MIKLFFIKIIKRFNLQTRLEASCRFMMVTKYLITIVLIKFNKI